MTMLLRFSDFLQLEGPLYQLTPATSLSVMMNMCQAVVCSESDSFTLPESR